jgi:hypothetical protein
MLSAPATFVYSEISPLGSPINSRSGKASGLQLNGNDLSV